MSSDPSGIGEGLAIGGKQFVLVSISTLIINIRLPDQ